MPNRRPLLRPGVLIERELLWCGPKDAQIVLPRSAARAIVDLRRLGFVIVVLDLPRDARCNAVELVRLHERLGRAVTSVGGSIDGAYAYPRPGAQLDPSVPRASGFTRLVLEASTRHGLDLARSTVLAATLDAVEGARTAGARCAMVGMGGADLDQAVRDRPGARPDACLVDMGAARAAIVAGRERSIAQGF